MSEQQIRSDLYRLKAKLKLLEEVIGWSYADSLEELQQKLYEEKFNCKNEIDDLIDNWFEMTDPMEGT